MRIELDTGTPAELVTVEGAQRGLVIIPDIWGLRPLYDDMVADLSQKTGFSVIAVEPFPGQDLPDGAAPDGMEQRSAALRSLDDSTLLADVIGAADALRTEEVVLVGFCMGGMYALKSAALGRFSRIVSFYGMIRVPEAWASPGQGQPLDAVPQRGATEIMAIIGTIDGFTPPDDVDALEALGVECVRYEGADHGFVHDPSRPAHRPDDAADAWQRALAFLAG